MHLALTLFAVGCLLAAVYLWRTATRRSKMSKQEQQYVAALLAQNNTLLDAARSVQIMRQSAGPAKIKKVTFKPGHTFSVVTMCWPSYGVPAIQPARPHPGGTIKHKSYRICMDDQEIGYLYHKYDKPSKKYEYTKTRSSEYAYRRGAQIFIDRNYPHEGRLLAQASDTSFKFRDAQALIRHCLLNQVSLEGMSREKIIELAQHCRSMELLQRRRR